MALKLTYFPIPGRAFVTRVCFGISGIQWTDEHVEMKDWKDVKGDTSRFPLGQLPVLTLPSGKVVTQSGAIMRYAAKTANLYPKDDDELCLFIDEILATADEVSGKIPMDPDEEVKKTKRLAFVADVMPKYLNFFEAKLGETEGPFFNDRLCLHDLYMCAMMITISSGIWDHISASVFDAYPRLKALEAAVKSHPLVVEHGKL